MVLVGNKRYLNKDELPDEVRLFPLEGALLLPGSVLPLSIFEPRYLSMFDDALAGDRIIAMIQPSFSSSDGHAISDLCNVGTLGRITSIAESGDGRYLVSLSGICRFRVKSEKSVKLPYRIAKISPFCADLDDASPESSEFKNQLLKHFRSYVDFNEIDVDFDDIEQLQVSDLVNLLASLLPFDVAEKQALLEADFDIRVQTLIALLEIGFADGSSDQKQTVQ